MVDTGLAITDDEGLEGFRLGLGYVVIAGEDDVVERAGVLSANRNHICLGPWAHVIVVCLNPERLSAEQLEDSKGNVIRIGVRVDTDPLDLTFGCGLSYSGGILKPRPRT